VILIAFGANLPDRAGRPPRDACEAALAAVAALPGLRLEAASPWYLSAPIPPSGQPDYVNGVARYAGDVDPAWLLRHLNVIEAATGRVRGEANAARTLDLDIVAMGPEGGLVRDSPDPVLPHPRAHLRAFVLRPLEQVAPGWLHPRLGMDVQTLLAGLPPQDLSLLPA
jgi:2-amino-4-hydroxy-6-hydroxymethyldihydropteridine diphosphokinase